MAMSKAKDQPDPLVAKLNFGKSSRLKALSPVVQSEKAVDVKKLKKLQY